MGQRLKEVYEFVERHKGYSGRIELSKALSLSYKEALEGEDLPEIVGLAYAVAERIVGKPCKVKIKEETWV